MLDWLPGLAKDSDLSRVCLFDRLWLLCDFVLRLQLVSSLEFPSCLGFQVFQKWVDPLSAVSSVGAGGSGELMDLKFLMMIAGSFLGCFKVKNLVGPDFSITMLWPVELSRNELPSSTDSPLTRLPLSGRFKSLVTSSVTVVSSLADEDPPELLFLLDEFSFLWMEVLLEFQSVKRASPDPFKTFSLSDNQFLVTLLIQL